MRTLLLLAEKVEDASSWQLMWYLHFTYGDQFLNLCRAELLIRQDRAGMLQQRLKGGKQNEHVASSNQGTLPNRI